MLCGTGQYAKQQMHVYRNLLLQHVTWESEMAGALCTPCTVFLLQVLFSPFGSVYFCRH